MQMINTTTEQTTVASAPRTDVCDEGKVVLGGGFRLTNSIPARVNDSGAVVLGGGFRNPLARVIDRGTVVLGGGFRLVGGA